MKKITKFRDYPISLGKYRIVSRDERAKNFLDKKSEEEKVFTEKITAESYVRLFNSARVFGTLAVEEIIEEK